MPASLCEALRAWGNGDGGQNALAGREGQCKCRSVFRSQVQLGNEGRRKFEYRSPNFEWSERDKRHGRQSCEGSSERARAANEFQTITEYLNGKNTPSWDAGG